MLITTLQMDPGLEDPVLEVFTTLLAEVEALILVQAAPYIRPTTRQRRPTMLPTELRMLPTQTHRMPRLMVLDLNMEDVKTLEVPCTARRALLPLATTLEDITNNIITISQVAPLEHSPHSAIPPFNACSSLAKLKFPKMENSSLLSGPTIPQGSSSLTCLPITTPLLYRLSLSLTVPW
jgi:hypothetical protein